MSAMLPTASAGEVRRFARRAFGARPAVLLATIGMLLLAGALPLIGPLAIGRVTQAVIDDAGTAAVLVPAAALVAAALLGGLATWAGARLLAALVLPIVATLRTEVVTTVLDLPVDDVEAAGSGDVVSRVTDDVEVVSSTSQGALGEFIGAALTIAVTVAGLASLDWRFAVAGLVAVPIQAHTLRWYLRVSGPVFGAARRAAGVRTAALLDSFGALPTIRAYRWSGDRGRIIADASAAVITQENAVMRMAGRFYGRLNLAEFTGLSLILAVGYWLVTSGQASIGEATSAALFFAALFNPINTALGVFDEIQAATAGLARMVGVLQAPRPIRSETLTPTRPAAIEVNGLSFRYPTGPPVISDLELRLDPGSSTAVVGPSGSGKTTLASVLAGHRRPTAGSALLGGVQVADIDPEQLRRTIAVVAQETHLFVGTVRHNLLLARPDADPAAVTTALTEVGAQTWISELPDGLDTAVGAGGHELSAAQTQHLALARVLLLDPEVVILDEATADAGSDADRSLDRAAQRVIRGRTAIVIAHRLSQAVGADRIIVMRDGRIVENGSHSELLAAGDSYSELWSAWTTPGHSTMPGPDL